MDTMSASINNGDSQSSALVMMIHEFVLHRSPVTTRASAKNHLEYGDDDDDDESDHYEVEQGENWLRLLHKEGHDSILDNTQDMSQQTPLYPSIVSLSSVGFLDAPSTDCYICVDLDGVTLAIKDMRFSENGKDDDEDEEDNPKASSNNQLGIARKGETEWEVLPRRQLRILHPGDRLCTSLSLTSSGNSMPEGLLLEYTFSEKKQEAVCETPVSTREGLGMLTQPQDDMSEEEMDNTQTQTEPTTPVKSDDLATEMVVLNDKDKDSKASDYDSDKTVDINDNEMTQNSIQVSSSIVICTQPNDEDCSDDETTLGEHANANHDEKSSAPQQEKDEIAIPCNGGESSKDDPDRTEPRDNSLDNDANLQDKINVVDTGTDQTMGRKEETNEETSFHQERSTAETQEGKDGMLPTHAMSVDAAADGGTNGSSNNVVVEGIDDAAVKSDIQKECKISANEDTSKQMSPSLCGETEDPPGPHYKTPANDTEPANDRASQSSDAISISLLCETAEQMPEKESQDLLWSSAAANDDKGEITGSNDKDSVPSGPTPPRHGESTKRIESQDDGDDDHNLLPDNDDDSATQVSSCVLPSNVEDKPDEQKAQHNEEGDAVSKQPEDSPRAGCGADQKESKPKEEEAKKNDRSQEMESTPERGSGVRSDNTSESPQRDSGVKNNKRRNGDGGVIDEQRPSASKRRKIDDGSSKSPATKTSKRLASPLESTNESSTANRKRTRASPTAKSAIEENVPQIRVMTTGIELSKEQKHIVKRIGGILLDKVSDAASATHVIAGSKGTTLRRTPKLMIGLCRTSNIVDLEWLLQSAKDRKPLPSKKFLLVKDGVAETQYDFNMRETLMRAGKLRSNGKTVLGTYSVFVCTGVAGNQSKDNRTPPLKEFRLILEAAGATWISSLPNSTSSSSIFSKVILIVSKVEREAKKQLSLKKVAEAVNKGAISQTTEEMFHGIMTQKFKL